MAEAQALQTSTSIQHVQFAKTRHRHYPLFKTRTFLHTKVILVVIYAMDKYKCLTVNAVVRAIDSAYSHQKATNAVTK
jgi:hypothetical protein